MHCHPGLSNTCKGTSCNGNSSTNFSTTSDENSDSADHGHSSDSVKPLSSSANSSDSSSDSSEPEQEDQGKNGNNKTAIVDNPNNEPSDEDDKPLSSLQKKLCAESANGKAKFKNVFHGLKCKHPRNRNFQCSNCDTTCRSQGALNQHFLEMDGTLQCEECGKQFKTISAIRMHMFKHGERTEFKQCEDCDKSFLSLTS